MGEKILLAAGGVISGFINGLLGTGGGIALIFVLGKLLKQFDGKDIFANTLNVTLILSVISALIYMKKGEISFNEDTVKYVVSAGIGGLIGAYLLEKLQTKYVRKIFAVLVIIAGANMAGIL